MESAGKGRVSSVMILEGGAEIISTPLEQVRVTEAGFEGDRHAGMTRPAGGRDPQSAQGREVRNTRQVSIVSDEELAEIARRLDVPAVEPHLLGANLSLRGIEDLSRLERGSRLIFAGGVELVVDAENQPCTAPGKALAARYPDQDALATRFPKEALRLRGLVGWVERPGVIRLEEDVTVQPPGPPAAA